jgi:hypothetical protein
MSVTVRTFRVLPLAAGKMRCARCSYYLREGEMADTLIDSTGFTQIQHNGACPDHSKPLPDPDGEWHIQGAKH